MKFMNLDKWTRTYMEEAGTDGAAGGGTPAPEPTPEPSPTPEPTPEPTPDPTIEEQVAEPTSTEDLYEGSEFFEAATHTFDAADIDGQVIVDQFQADGAFHPEHIALMEERLGKAQAQIMMKGIENEIAGQKATEQENVQRVYDAVGGEETFKAAAAWAASEESGWDSEDREAMNELLGMGGRFAEWGAQLLYIGYQNAGGIEAAAPKGDATLLDGSASGIQGIQPINYSDYRSALAKATSQGEVDAIVKRANYTLSQPNAVDYGFKYHR